MKAYGLARLIIFGFFFNSFCLVGSQFGSLKVKSPINRQWLQYALHDFPISVFPPNTVNLMSFDFNWQIRNMGSPPSNVLHGKIRGIEIEIYYELVEKLPELQLRYSNDGGKTWVEDDPKLTRIISDYIKTKDRIRQALTPKDIGSDIFATPPKRKIPGLSLPLSQGPFKPLDLR